jgi:Mg2+/citrate symporter
MPTRKAPAKRKSPIVALYAVPIHACIRRGNVAEMRKMAAQARKHVRNVTAALAVLEKKLAN